MTSQTVQTFVDYSGEITTMGLWNPDLNVSNVETYTSLVATNALADLLAAVDALTLLNRTRTNVGAITIPIVTDLPTNKDAQREQKMQIKYADDVTGKKYQVTLPGIDRTIVAQQGTDKVDFVGVTEVATLVTEMEANYLTELGNALTVYDVRLVGRNN